MIKKSLLKTVCLLIIIGLNWTGLLAVDQASAFFSNNEDSNANTFTASTLDFSLSSPGDFSPSVLAPGQSATRNISVNKDGSLDFQYNIQSVKTGGDDDFCDALQLEARLEGEVKYNDSLMGFNLDFPVVIGADGQDDWLFTVTLPTGVPETIQEKTCQFKFIFDGWQSNLPDSSAGFSDTEEITNLLQSGKWVIYPGDVVINELMWMGSYKKSKDEWIELRNMTDSPIDIGGWQLTKLSGKKNKEKLMLKIPSGKTIPAAGFFLISNFDKDKSAINVEPDLVNKKVALRNKNLQVKLYKGDWKNSDNLIDTADDGKGKPLAGFHGRFFHFSMERNNIPGDGTQEANWHTCFDDSQEMRDYWDSKIIHNKSVNRGTPGEKNLSDYNEAELIEYYQQLETEWLTEGLFLPDLISDEENYDEEEIPTEGEPLIEEEPPIEGNPVTEEFPVNNEETPADEEISVDGEKTVGEIADETIDEIINDIGEDTESMEDRITIEGTIEVFKEASGGTNEDVIEIEDEDVNEGVTESTVEEVVEETVEETTDEVIDETIIDVVVESEPESEPEQIEETPVKVISETSIIDETPADETFTDETYEQNT